MNTSSDQPSGTTGSHFQPSLPVVLVILVLFVGTAFLVERSPSPASHTSSPVSSTTVKPGKPGKPTVTTTTAPKETRVPRSQVSVQVANGTSITGFAKTVTQQLQTLGWNTLSAINGPHETATVVYYKSGFKWAALEVAAAVKVGPSSIRALGTLQPVPGSTGDDLVVVLGPNAH